MTDMKRYPMSRVAAGRPAGGQFAARHRDESTITLADPARPTVAPLGPIEVADRGLVRAPDARASAARAVIESLPHDAPACDVELAHREEVAAWWAGEMPGVCEIFTFHNEHAGRTDYLFYNEDAEAVPVQPSPGLAAALEDAHAAITRGGTVTFRRY